jgi:hypothetical protein
MKVKKSLVDVLAIIRSMFNYDAKSINNTMIYLLLFARSLSLSHSLTHSMDGKELISPMALPLQRRPLGRVIGTGTVRVGSPKI